MYCPGKAITMEKCALLLRDSGLLNHLGICASCRLVQDLLMISDTTNHTGYIP